MQKLKETSFKPDPRAIQDALKNFKCMGKPFKPPVISMSDTERLNWQNKFINQMLMSIKDDFIRQKYFKFIMDNQIEIVSDIFERMETDRKLKDEMMRLARNS